VYLTISNGAEKINKGLKILKNVPLAPLTSFGTGGKADYLATVTTFQQLKETLAWANERQLPLTLLGGGTNVLISDRGVEGLVIVTTALTAHYVQNPLFVCQAGLPLDTAIDLMNDNYLCGLEPLGGLPGSVGGAVYGNASANGESIASHIEWIDYLSREGQLSRYYRRDDDFSYKKSPFSDTEKIIWEVAFHLKPCHDPSKMRVLKEESRAKRKARGQYDYPSAGCIFKNPSEGPAGYFIEQAGFKGYSLGGATVSSKHANFVIIKGETTSQAIYDLTLLVEKGVLERFGIPLEREIRLVGRW
jgi:UDP-N-acetylmuramate dehydrogenase